jgi:transposase-like protein
MIGLAISLWPIVYEWIVDRVKARIVYVDEKWLKIRGKWHYWFVVMDHETELPVLASLQSSKGEQTCKWIGCMLKRISKIPRVIITDPFGTVLGVENVKKNVKMADLGVQQCIAAQS